MLLLEGKGISVLGSSGKEKNTNPAVMRTVLGVDSILSVAEGRIVLVSSFRKEKRRGIPRVKPPMEIEKRDNQRTRASSKDVNFEFRELEKKKERTPREVIYFVVTRE